MDTPVTQRYTKKVIANGNVLEVYRYQYPVTTGFKGRGGRRKKDEPKSKKSSEYRKSSGAKARNEVRRLCLANFDNGSKFITLTFSEGSIPDVKDVEAANKQFTNFIKRLRRRYGDFKYLAVVQFQDFNGRGAVHYHMLSDLPYIPYKELSKLWGLGYVGINRITDVDNVGAYMNAYMDKGDPRLFGKKLYFKSNNLSESIVLVGEAAEMVIQEYGLENKKEVYANSYESEYFGTVNYAEYNLKRK